MIKLAIVLMMFITAIDITIMSTIMPQIIASIGDMALYPLMSSAYLLASVIATPIFGVVADHFGCKKSAYMALGIFLMGSLFCGISFSMQHLVFARLVQGAGGGGLINICFISIAKLYKHDSKRSLAAAVLSSVWACASIIGPFLGAFITDTFSWRWVFFINLPIGLIAGYCLYFFKEKHSHLEDKFDLKSIFIFAGATIALFFSFTRVLEHGLSSERIILLIIALLCFIYFVRRSLNSTSPLIPIHLLKSPVVATCIVLGIVSGACLTTVSTLVSLYIQGALRLSLQKAGFTVAATSLGWTTGSFFCGLMLKKIGLRAVAITAFCFLISGFGLLSSATLDKPFYYFIVSNYIVGVGLGAIVNTTIIGVQRSAPHKFIGRATTFLSLVRSAGAGLGALVGGFIQLYYFRTSIEKYTGSAISEATGSLLLVKPEKFLEKSMPTSIDESQFHFLAEIFGQSIDKVFMIPVIVLLIFSSILWLLPNKSVEHD